MLAGNAIKHEEVSVARRLQDELAWLAAQLAVYNDRRLRRIPIVRIVRRSLVIPSHLARIDVYRHQRAGEEVVAETRLRRVSRRWVSGPENIELRIGIVSADGPDLRSAVAGRIEARPRIKTSVALLHRHGVMLPLHFARFRIKRLQEAGRVEIVARADEQ